MAGSKAAIVAGGTGGIGEGIVKALIELGWTVHVPTRQVESVDRLRTYLGSSGPGRLEAYIADLSLAADVADFRKRVVAASGSVDLVVVSVGSSYYGYSLHKLPEADWVRLMTENLSTHYHIQRELLALLHEQNKGAYVTLTGPEADFAHPETGLMSIHAAAQKMMARVEAMEAVGTGVRVYSVTSKTPVAVRSRGEQSGANWITPIDLGRYVAALADARVPGASEPLHQLESADQLRGLLKG